MRETLEEKGFEVQSGGITPAYAGNTTNLSLFSWYSWDHPRVCGKHATIDLTQIFVAGSPPRMRETLEEKGFEVQSGGITPAYAGNTTNLSLFSWYSWDHPRVCGKHATIDLTQIFVAGSPPRMRETHEMAIPMMRESRITPAYAGNTR